MTHLHEYERKVHFAHKQPPRRHKVADTLCAMNSKVPAEYITTDPTKVTCRLCRKDKRFAAILSFVEHGYKAPPAPAPHVAPSAPPVRRRFLSGLYADWVRAPISGTLILLCQVVAFACFCAGQIDRGMLFLLMAQLWINQRGPLEGGTEV